MAQLDSPRIASLLPSATEIVAALDLRDSLVGVTHECDHPPEVADKPWLTSSGLAAGGMSSAEIDHAVRSQLDGHGSIYELAETRLRELAPDLVLTQELCDVCAVSYEIVQQATRRVDSDATVVSLEPNTLEDIFANVHAVGELTGVPGRADEVVSALRGRLAALDRVIAECTGRPRTLVLEWLDPPFSPGHWVPEQVAHAGGESSFGQSGEPSRTMTSAEIQEYEPEVLVLAPCGFGIAHTLRELPNTGLPAGWADLPAVRHGQVWAVDANAHFSRPGPRTIDGAEILAGILHPEAISPPDPRHAVRVPLDPS